MRLELIESLSLPSDAEKPNEDSFEICASLASVFDGATGLGERLMPGPSDAKWIAQFGARRLRAHAEFGEGDLRDWLRAAAADTEKSFRALRKRPPLENYEIAFASAVMVAPRNSTLQVLWFGDCAALLRTANGTFEIVGEAIAKRESERARVNKLVKPGGRGPAAIGVRDEFLPALRATRNLVNTGSEWLFAPDEAIADHASEVSVPIDTGTKILLASDGFLALASDYARYTPEALFDAAVHRGLADLGKELRTVENADPEGLQYPRFKRSDDATAILLRVIV